MFTPLPLFHFLVRSLYAQIIVFSIMCIACNIYGQNLIPNPGFESDSVAPLDKPDNFHPRSTTLSYHHVETNASNVYAGSKCAMFNNDSGVSNTCYYYASYSADGATADYINAETDCEYELSIKYKTDSSFSGDGIRIQILFYDDNVLIGIVESSDYISSSWDTIKLRGKAQGRVNKITAVVYYRGQGKAWVDDISLTKLSEPLCINSSFETNNSSPSDIPDFFKPRSTTTSYHHVETDPEYSYIGYSAALFDSPVTLNTCYLYGPYSADGISSNYIPVCPGDSYTISGFGRVESAFSGNGVRLSLIFWNGSSYDSRQDSAYNTSTAWSNISKEVIVPADVDYMSYSVEYRGIGEAWVDKVKLEPKNLIVNSSFESDATNTDTPDYWFPRLSNYHHVETNASNVYEGSQCALFNNNSGSSTTCYFYGPAAQDSSSKTNISVIPGEVYDISAWVKTDAAFSGTGVKVCLIFQNDGTYVSRIDSSYYAPSSWTKITAQGTVPENVNELRYSIECIGENKAWFDKIELYKTDSPWYLKAAPTSSLENLDFTAPSKVSLNNMINRFNSIHNYYENYYNGDGSWGDGYGSYPLVRCSANAVLGYLHAYKEISNQTFLNRAEAGLEWLLDEQLASGAFPYYATSTPITTGGGVMYESGIAGAALIEGYRTFNDSRYLSASNDLCDYFVSINASYNANFNGFVIWALMENYKETNNSTYLAKALYFADCMVAYQKESGTWEDEHNQNVYYHSICTRGLIEILSALPASHPKKGAIEDFTYKAINNIIRRQKISGALITHPSSSAEMYDTHTTVAMSMAYAWLNMSGIDDPMATITNGALNFYYDTTQGFDIQAVGTLLDLAY